MNTFAFAQTSLRRRTRPANIRIARRKFTASGASVRSWMATSPDAGDPGVGYETNRGGWGD
ncbi:secreted protein [Rhodopirellula sallentina SM41]|uniref:Secreted protein n=1 Tax=Rhodopirellula sallentina SM41 TaxID=1263870 RepID=M5U3X1_9BACT|nr:secreted protein [Rhodopirellula sallentina SM41]